MFCVIKGQWHSFIKAVIKGIIKEAEKTFFQYLIFRALFHEHFNFAILN